MIQSIECDETICVINVVISTRTNGVNDGGSAELTGPVA